MSDDTYAKEIYTERLLENESLKFQNELCFREYPTRQIREKSWDLGFK